MDEGYEALFDDLRPAVDLTALCSLCAQGIPKHPRHLRALCYSLLVGSLPPEKAKWDKAREQNRRVYEDLVVRLSSDIEQSDDPLEPLSASDEKLRGIAHDVERLKLRGRLRPDCPRHSRAILKRIDRIGQGSRQQELGTRPELTLSPPPLSTPQLSLSLASSSSPITLLPSRQLISDTSIRSSAPSIGPADTAQESMTRLLFVLFRDRQYHSAIAEIIPPLYHIFVEDSPEEDMYHFLSRVMELAEEPNLQRLSYRVRWLDETLYQALCSRNLDPATPLYAYRWMTTLWVHDVPDFLPLWDYCFSQQDRVGAGLDICTAILVLTWPMISPHSKGFWGQEDDEGEEFVRAVQLLRGVRIPGKIIADKAKQIRDVHRKEGFDEMPYQAASTPPRASLQHRLTGLLGTPPSRSDAVLPRTLLLSSSARRASNSSNRAPSSIASPTGSTLTESLTDSPLYRIRSRQSNRSPRLSHTPDHSMARELEYEGSMHLR
ncbi:hypothetical protein BCR39DRAFT_550255 [Naematelia encephala]|uniref:Rab-GAP TBC domain-containing protein n=1 Tax=Naematelia encephala TaxID=71784 RepID=A0A1Y2AK99_9TREE|nr:hypothetical protein BCR39DRAFT_550255 [Naematelia encephala]